MSNGKFTTQAAVLWGAIPLEAQERILKAVFCVKCRTAVQIVNFTGAVEEKTWQHSVLRRTPCPSPAALQTFKTLPVKESAPAASCLPESELSAVLTGYMGAGIMSSAD